MISTRRRVLLTGATGFVGQAVLLALLERTEDVDIVCVVRGRPGQPAQQRLEALLEKSAFTEWVDARGSDAARSEFARRVSAIEGDLTGLERNEAAIAALRDGAPLFAAVHCASAVSFDLPLDEAFDTNVGGALGVYGVLAASGQTPHVVHVSTAYVGGSARGLRTEGPLPHRIDWRAEMKWAHEARRDAELASRSADALARHLGRAQILHGKEGPNAVAAAADAARREAVEERLVDEGRLRAQTLGWTDVYTFTKAMAERVAEEQWAGAGHRLSVVRPSIIESSFAWPRPGWIDGYKVADPLIMAYGKGVLWEFPALPDSILDVIPVDMVVGVVLALVLSEDAGRVTPEKNEPGRDETPAQTRAPYYQVVSGTSNPLPFHAMVDAVRTWFTAHPLTDDRGRPIKVPTWSYRRGHLVEPVIGLQESAVKAAEFGATMVPRRSARSFAGKLHKQRAGLATLRKFVDLYKNYTRTELVFDDRHTRELLAELRGANCALPGHLIDFDVTKVVWHDYFTQHHLPGLVALTGEYSAGKKAKREADAAAASAPVVPGGPGERVMAVFDLDGTVSDSTVVTQYLEVLKGVAGFGRRGREIASLAWHTPSYLRTERRARGAFLRTFLRRFAGVRAADLDAAVSGRYAGWLRGTLRPDALERIRAHREAGHWTVLVTGTPSPLVAPLADLFDDVISTPLEERDGVFTGFVAAPPVVDEARAAWLLRYAGAHDLDLSASYGYGDSQADVTWLSLLGKPFAVDPDLGLYAEAKRTRWPIVDWR